MSRNARRREPALRPKTKLELNEGHFSLRLVGVAVFIAIAALAFGIGINDLLRTQTGWQQVEASASKTGIAQEFALCYNIGQTETDAKAELRGVSACYSETLDRAYRVLSNTPREGYVNLSDLNAQPNTAIAVDPLLYAAFQTVEASGSRLPYFAPLLGQYWSLFACANDQEAESFDPDRSEEAAQFAAEVAGFAQDPEAVQVKLLPGNTLRLEVSPAYLDYARENELDSFVDLGLLLNAFICDAVADALEAGGYTNGYVTSFDGFTRALCKEEFGLNVFDLKEGSPAQLGTALYDGPGTVVSCRAFPVLYQDEGNYFTYSDGTVVPPYLNHRGRLHAACASLNTFSSSHSAGALALLTLAAYAGEDSGFPTLEAVSWVSGENGQIHFHGEDFHFPE